MASASIADGNCGNDSMALMAMHLATEVVVADMN